MIKNLINKKNNQKISYNSLFHCKIVKSSKNKLKNNRLTLKILAHLPLPIQLKIKLTKMIYHKFKKLVNKFKKLMETNNNKNNNKIKLAKKIVKNSIQL